MVNVEPRPSRRHNKNRSVGVKHRIIRQMVLRLISDASSSQMTLSCPTFDPLSTPGQQSGSFTDSNSIYASDLLGRSCFLCNLLCGGKALSSFELARGYTPAIGEIPQIPVSDVLCRAHLYQTSRSAIQRLLKDRTDALLPAQILPRNIPVYYFVRNGEFGTWNEGFFRETGAHVLEVSAREDHKCTSNKVAYEDIRLRPDNSLLQELDNMEFKFPRSYSIIDIDMEPYLPDPATIPAQKSTPAPDVPP